jgi:hypothetical protein
MIYEIGLSFLRRSREKGDRPSRNKPINDPRLRRPIPK